MLRITTFPTAPRVVTAILVLAVVFALVFAQAARAAGEAITVPTSDVTVAEGASATYQVELAGDAPDSDVTVTISSGNSDVTMRVDGSDAVSRDLLILTFIASNHDDAQIVQVFAAEDADALDEVATLTHVVSSADADFWALGDERVTVRITDNDAADATFAAEAVDDMGAPIDIDPTTDGLTVDEARSGVYTVKLDAQPGGDVMVAITSNDEDVVTVRPESLTFTPENWDGEQTVTVHAADDDDTANGGAMLTHVFSSGDAEFDDLTDKTVSVTVTDDDEAGVRYSTSALQLTESDLSSYTVVLTAAPTVDLTVTVSSADGSAVGVRTDATAAFGSSADLTFTSDNWRTPQTVMVSAVGDTDATDEEVALTHAFAASGDDNYHSDALADAAVAALGDDATSDEEDAAKAAVTTVTVSVTDTNPGVRLSATSVAVDEGSSDTYTIVLQSAPTANVTVDITRSDSSSPNSDVTVSPASLTFTSGNWDRAQPVRVALANDADTASENTVTLSHSITSDDTGYSSLTVGGVSVTFTDDDEAGVRYSTSALQLTEGDLSSYTVVLTAAPTVDLTVTVSSADGSAVGVKTDATAAFGSSADLTFTSDNWRTPQTVMVSAVGDTDATDEEVALTHAFAASGDDNYHSDALADAAVAALGDDATSDEEDAAKAAVTTVTVSVTDTNPGVRLSATSLDLTEGGQPGQFTVVLQSLPALSHDVTIAISSDNLDVTVSPESLTFTSADWDMPQTVEVTVTADEDVTPDTATLTVTTRSSDSNYHGLTDISVSVAVADGPGLVVSVSEIRLTEADDDSTVEETFTVALEDAPAAGMDVTVAISSDNQDVTVSPESLTFTSTNATLTQSVTVTVAADGDAADDTAVITLAVSSEAAGFDANDNAMVTVTVFDVDVETVTQTQTVTVPGPSRTKTVTETVIVEVPAAANVVGGTGAATATEVNGQVVITRHDGGASLVINIGGFIRDDAFGQTYQVVRRADGKIVRQWVSPNSPLVYQIPWAVVTTQFTVPVGVVGTIPLDDQAGAPGQLVRRFDGGDDRIFSYDAGLGNWRHVPNIPTFQALGLYWCDVTAADAAFFDRINIGPAHPATDMPARSDYPSCSTG